MRSNWIPRSAIGSNILNKLAVRGLTALNQPFAFQGVPARGPDAMMLSVAFLHIMLGRRFTLDRIKSSILITCYAAYIYTLLA